MVFYNLPLGIRIPNDDEYPDNLNVKDINDRRNNANITEGFTIKEVSNEKFTHYFEVNVNVEKIWDVFSSISNKIIGNIAYGIIGLKDDELKLSDFTARDSIINIFKGYSFELVNDGFLQFGIAFNDENSLNEIFVSSFKYMKIWTNKKELLIDVLTAYEIGYIEKLNFIDEFPVVSEALSCDNNKDIRHYSKVMENIVQEFENVSKQIDN